MAYVSRVYSLDLLSTRVPKGPDCPQLREYRFRNPVCQLPMHPKAERHAAPKRQRDVIAWQLYSHESVVLFEIGQAIVPLPSVGEFVIHKVGDMTIGTRPDSLSD